MGAGVSFGALPGKRLLKTYKTRGAAEKKAEELKKKGYPTRIEWLYNNYELWVSRRYFKDHPRVKAALD